jgi:hypothetical protein
MGKQLVTILLCLATLAACSGKLGEAKQAAETGNFDQAHQIIDLVLSDNPKDHKALFLKGELYEQQTQLIFSYVYYKLASQKVFNPDYFNAASASKTILTDRLANCNGLVDINFKPAKVPAGFKLEGKFKETYDQIEEQSGFRKDGVKAPTAALLIDFASSSRNINSYIESGSWIDYRDIYTRFFLEPQLKAFIFDAEEQIEVVRTLVAYLNWLKGGAWNDQVRYQSYAAEAREAGRSAKVAEYTKKMQTAQEKKDALGKEVKLFTGVWHISIQYKRAACINGQNEKPAEAAKTPADSDSAPEVGDAQ